MPRPATALGPERLLTGLVLDEPDRWQEGTQGFSLDEVIDPTLRRLLGILEELRAAGNPTTPAHVVSRLAEEGQAHAALVAELVELAQATPAKDEAFADCLRRLRAGVRTRELAQLREQIQAAQEAGHEDEVQRLLADYQHRLSTAPSGAAVGVTTR